MTAVLWLVEITVYDPAIPGTRVVRYANRAFATRPTEVPANAIFDARFTVPSLLKRDVYDSKTTGGRSRVGFADLKLSNGDGVLDFFNDVAVDGRAVTIYRGVDGAAFPAGFTKYAGVIEQALVSRKEVTIKLRDRALELAVPAQPAKYLGNNALPAGLEGVAGDLKGKPKPILVGQVTNITPRLVNSAKLIYQVNDGPVQSFDAVYDRGVALGNSLFIAAGGGATLNPASSGDGKSWSLANPNLLPSHGITCGCAGAAGTMVFGFAQFVFYSISGGTWQNVAISASFVMQAIAYNGVNQYCAVGYNGGTFVGEIWTSPDLITWTLQAGGLGAASGRCVAWDATNTQWVVGGDISKLSTSNAAGTVWTAQTTGTLGTIAAVVPMPAIIVIGTSNGEIRTSPTGAVWTNHPGTPFSAGPKQIFTGCFGGGIALLGGEGGLLASSVDGINWTVRASKFATSDAILVSMYAGGQFTIGGDNGSIAYSPEGINFTLVSAGYAANSYQVRALSYATGVLIGAYASLADLQDDTLAPAPGTFKGYLAGGYFRIGSSPAGTITSDVTEGATSADRTHAQAFKRLMQRWGYASGADFSAADIVAFDIANSAVMGGYWPDEIDRNAILDELAGSAGAWWGPDRLNVFRFQQFAAPTGAPDFILTENDIKSIEPSPTQDVGRGVPAWRSVLRWGRNYTVQGGGDVAAGVTAARRAFVELEYREAKFDDAAVQTAHLLAQEVDEDSLIVNEADAITEVTRRQGIRGVPRRLYTVVVELNDTTAAAELFQQPQIIYPRFGMGGGRLFRILGAEPAPATKRLTLTVWG